MGGEVQELLWRIRREGYSSAWSVVVGSVHGGVEHVGVSSVFP